MEKEPLNDNFDQIQLSQKSQTSNYNPNVAIKDVNNIRATDLNIPSCENSDTANKAKFNKQFSDKTYDGNFFDQVARKNLFGNN